MFGKFAFRLALFVAIPGFVHGQEEVPPGKVAAQPYIVCPPKFSTPMFVSQEELLQSTENVEHLAGLPSNWIVVNRPVPSCENCFGDLEQFRDKMFEYPMKLRMYESQIRMLQAEIAALQRLAVNYDRFNKLGALPVTVERTRLNLLSAQERLRNLRYEKMLWMRQSNLERQLQQATPIVDEVVVQ